MVTAATVVNTCHIRMYPSTVNIGGGTGGWSGVPLPPPPPSFLTPHSLGTLRICELESAKKGDNVPK